MLKELELFVLHGGVLEIITIDYPHCLTAKPNTVSYTAPKLNNPIITLGGS